jgi:DNA-binding PadR family transcriptional regulator
VSEEAKIDLLDALETVEEFGSSSLELLAWEFSMEPADLWPLWRDAVAEQLLERVEVDPAGEEIYRLTALGQERLEELRRRKAS